MINTIWPIDLIQCMKCVKEANIIAVCIFDRRAQCVRDGKKAAHT